jgi:hypothetical protein
VRRFAVGLLVFVSALSLVLASTSLWTRRNVVNTQVFVTNVETMVDLPQVEARITQRVTSTVMANPQVQQTIDDALTVLPPRLQTFRSTVEEGISSLVSAGVRRLLTDDPFRPLTQAALTSAHDQLVAGEPVRFTLGQAKERVPTSAKTGIAGQILDLLPDNVGVTILTPADAPQLYTAIDLLQDVWWWLGLLALGTFAGALGVSRRRRRTLRAWAVTTTVLTLLVLLALRVARGVLLPQVRPENRDAVGAIYDVLAASLRSWTLWLLAAALLVLVLTLVWGRLGIVAGVRRGVASARAQVQRRREARVAAAAAGGTEPEAAAVEPREPWTRRVAIWTHAFAEGLDLPGRAARLGGLVRDHLVPARWTGIAIGALLLLFWPAPTLSVLIWIVALVALYLGRTRPGLNLRAVGEDPAATDAMGLSVAGLRYLYVVLGGMLAGLGGAYISLAYNPGWTENMTAGRGWIAVGLVVFGTWDPLRVMAGAYLFGFVDGFQLRAQGLGSTIPSFFLNMLPYLFTVLVVSLSSGERLQRRLGIPRALGLPYWREERT